MLKDPSSPMASPLTLRSRCFLLALLCLSTECCKSDQNPGENQYEQNPGENQYEPNPVNIVARALICFNNRYVYSSCQESYRLSAEGNINVSPEKTDEYCNGPCMGETNLVLQCVDGILYNFQFYNGATVQDVKYTIDSACGHTNKRGDFNVMDRLKGDDGENGHHGHANKLGFPMDIMLLLGCVLLLWCM